MIRRSLYWLLVIAVAANPLGLGVVHSHDDTAPADHGSRAHVHLAGHFHGPDSHHHHHDGKNGDDHDREDWLPDDQTPDSDMDPNCPFGHDDDAVYFGEQDLLGAQSFRLLGDVAQTVSWCGRASVTSWRSRWISFHTGQADNSLRFHCAIYLQSCRFLI